VVAPAGVRTARSQAYALTRPIFFFPGRTVIELLNSKIEAALDAARNATLNSKRRIAINKQAWGSCHAISQFLGDSVEDAIISR